MTTKAGTVVGCIVYDREEFKTWVSNNSATSLASGLRRTKRRIWSTSLPDFFSSMRNWGTTLSDVASHLRVFT
jgi:hypothetical protein